jgi:aspartate/methionine/tyrosine aminotransferase
VPGRTQTGCCVIPRSQTADADLQRTCDQARQKQRAEPVPRHRLRPGGGSYAFPNIIGTGYSARELQDDLLGEVRFALLAGTSFGEQGEGYIRFSYTNSIANIEEAIDRIARFLER